MNWFGENRRPLLCTLKCNASLTKRIWHGHKDPIPCLSILTAGHPRVCIKLYIYILQETHQKRR